MSAYSNVEKTPHGRSRIADLGFVVPKAASTGLPFARGRMDPTGTLWVHAAPDTLTVTVRQGGRVLAEGKDLTRSGPELPTTRLWLEGGEVRREDRWPGAGDTGNLIILPGER